MTSAEVQSKLLELQALKLRLADVESRQYLFMDSGPKDSEGKTKGDKQREFHGSTARIRGLYTGNRWGKSSLVCNEFIWHCNKRHPFKEVPARPYRLRACADGWKVGVEGLMIPLFQRWVDPDDLVGGSWSDAYRQGDHTLTFRDGSTIQFMSYEIADTGRDAQKFAGVDLDGFWHDEASPYTVWEENMARIVDRNGWAVNTLTPVLGESWEYDGIYQRWQNGEPGFACWTGSTYENQLLDKTAIDDILGNIEDPLMREIRLYGVWRSIAGAVYPEFADRHIIPYNFQRVLQATRYIVIDPAPSKPTAVVWFGVGEDNQAFAYRDARLSGRIEWIVDQIRDLSKKDGGIYKILFDPNWDYEDKQFGTNVQREYEKCGMAIHKASDDKWGGIEQVKKALAGDALDNRPRFVVMDNCERLIWEFKHYRFKPKSPADDNQYKPKTRDVDDDEVTCVRYFLMDNPAYRGSRKAEVYRSHVRIPRHNRMRLRFTGVG